MPEVIWGLGAFAVAMLLHVAVWRVRVPRSAVVMLAFAFALVFAGTTVAYVLAGQASLAGWVYWSLLYCVMAASHVLTYNGIAYDSPALALVYRLGQAGERGVGPDELEEFIAKRPFVRSRLNQLLHDNLVRTVEGRLVVSSQARELLRSYDRVRAILGRRFEGG